MKYHPIIPNNPLIDFSIIGHNAAENPFILISLDHITEYVILKDIAQMSSY